MLPFNQAFCVLFILAFIKRVVIGTMSQYQDSSNSVFNETFYVRFVFIFGNFNTIKNVDFRRIWTWNVGKKAIISFQMQLNSRYTKLHLHMSIFELANRERRSSMCILCLVLLISIKFFVIDWDLLWYFQKRTHLATSYLDM